MRPVYLFFLWVTFYGVVTTVLGAQGIYISEDLLKTFPGLWLQLVTVGVIVTPIVVIPKSQGGIARNR